MVTDRPFQCGRLCGEYLAVGGTGAYLCCDDERAAYGVRTINLSMTLLCAGVTSQSARHKQDDNVANVSALIVNFQIPTRNYRRPPALNERGAGFSACTENQTTGMRKPET